MPAEAGRALWKPAVLAAAAGVAVFLLGTAAESLIIRAVHGNRSELEWLSDATISMAVAGLTYLWLHLKASRMHVVVLQQEQIAINEQLRLAAEIQRGLLPGSAESHSRLPLGGANDPCERHRRRLLRLRPAHGGHRAGDPGGRVGQGHPGGPHPVVSEDSV